MWKLKRLKLKNFALIKSGLDKDDLELNIENDKSLFYLFIGKMGSGKSAILGHIQPFATYGTLDTRNQTDQILEGKNGVKEIDFIHNNDLFEITHLYTWNKNSLNHNTKSYIKLNGVELNQNGNVNSFKELIQTYFGIDQNQMRLLRLGSNVTNLIDLKSTDRKNYMSSRLYDAEIYNILSKKLNETLRTNSAKVSLLSDRLLSLSSSSIDELTCELDEINTSILEYEKNIDSIKQTIVSNNTEISILTNNQSIDILKESENRLSNDIEDIKQKEILLSGMIDKVKDVDISIVNKKIGELEYRKSDLNKNIFNLNIEIKDLNEEIVLLKNKLNISNSEDQLELLLNTKKELEKTKDNYTKYISKYKLDIPISYSNLSILKDDLAQLQYLIEEISQNDKNTIRFLFHTTSSIQKLSNDKINMLTGRKINLHKKLNNLEFSKSYVPMQTMYRAPFCPSKMCPYYITHPVKLIDDKSNVSESIESIMNEISLIDKDIEYYTLLPLEYKKLENVISLWKLHSKTLKMLNVLNSENLENILLDRYLRSDWYDNNKLSEIIEVIKMKEDYSDIISRLKILDGDIAELQSSSIIKLKDEILSKNKELSEKYNKLEDLSNELKVVEEDYNTQEDLRLQYEKVVKTEEELSSIQSLLKARIEEYNTLTLNIEKVSNLVDINKTLQIDLLDLKSKLNPLLSKVKDVENTIKNVKYTQEELDTTTEHLEYLKDIVYAISSKDGIPLVLIQIFLQSCKNIVNSLISGLFDDKLEILDFELNETDFKIPYSINGKIIQDIESASQGQKAIIEIALSFALITQLRESNNHPDPYNIMLLDEKDSSLYKKDRDKFAQIIFNQSRVINAEQVFMITHNQNSFNDTDLSVIMTTDEIFDVTTNNVYRLY